MNFRVGQKVVCIKGYGSRRDVDCRIFPQTGRTYTIRAIEDGLENVGSTFFLLEEIYNEPYDYRRWGWQEPSFNAQRFRPVVEKKTDISIFTEMLKPKQRELISP